MKTTTTSLRRLLAAMDIDGGKRETTAWRRFSLAVHECILDDITRRASVLRIALLEWRHYGSKTLSAALFMLFATMFSTSCTLGRTH